MHVFEQLIQLNELLVKGTRPKTELNSAANYIKSHQEHLGNYLNDGEAEIGDNTIEWMIKAFVLSRKNSCFLIHTRKPEIRQSVLPYCSQLS